MTMARRRSLTVGELLALRPVPLAPWEERDGRVLLRRPRPEGRGVRGLLERAAAALSSPTILLDVRGSAVWRLLDGRRTGAEVAAALREAEGGELEAAEARVALFLHQLYRHGMIGLE